MSFVLVIAFRGAENRIFTSGWAKARVKQSTRMVWFDCDRPKLLIPLRFQRHCTEANSN
jgi:hypothetical protein